MPGESVVILSIVGVFRITLVATMGVVLDTPVLGQPGPVVAALRLVTFWIESLAVTGDVRPDASIRTPVRMSVPDASVVPAEQGKLI
jgi:hypothetical protein